MAGLAPFFILGAPGSIGALRPATGTAPVPLAAVTEQNLHPKQLFKTDSTPGKQSGTCLGFHPGVSVSDRLASGNVTGRYSSVDIIVLKYVRTPGEEVTGHGKTNQQTPKNKR